MSAELIAPLGPDPKLTYELDTELKHGRAEDVFFVEAQYHLQAFQGADQDSDTPFMDVSCELLAIYDLPQRGDDDYEDRELEAFTNTTAQFALFPYARELIFDLTRRLGVPPLTLGILRVPLDAREVPAELKGAS